MIASLRGRLLDRSPTALQSLKLPALDMRSQ